MDYSINTDITPKSGLAAELAAKAADSDASVEVISVAMAAISSLADVVGAADDEVVASISGRIGENLDSISVQLAVTGHAPPP